MEGGARRQVQERGTYIYLWLIHVDIWQKPAQHCKRNYPPIKNKLKKIFLNNKIQAKKKSQVGIQSGWEEESLS